MAYTFDNLTVECGTEGIGGMKLRVLVIPSCAIKVRPALIAAPATDDDYVTAIGAYEFKDALTQHPIYVAVSKDTAGYKADPQGDTVGCKSFKQTGEFYYAKDTKRASAFARQVNNQLCDIVFERPDGTQIVMFDAEVAPTCDLGKKAVDKFGYMFSCIADNNTPRIFLGTKIDMDLILNPVV